jgi:histidyl-tRNA synthetase
MNDALVADSFQLDPSITRGLDYYTGIVAESFLDALPAIGSVCSGGRYDRLLSLYSKEALPGVGASVGLDRLLAALEASGAARRTYASVAVVYANEAATGKAQALAEQLRSAGIATEALPPAKKQSAAFIAAEKRGIPTALILADDGTITLRDIATRQNQSPLSIGEAISVLVHKATKSNE